MELPSLMDYIKMMLNRPHAMEPDALSDRIVCRSVFLDTLSRCLISYPTIPTAHFYSEI